MLNNIEAERGRMRLSKTSISEKLGITTKTYNGYINGTPIPHPMLIRMADLFNCRIDYLLGLSESRT